MRREKDAKTLGSFIAGASAPGGPIRVAGTAIYLTKHTEHVPAPLWLNIQHNGVLHEHVILLTVTTDRSPRLPESRRIEIEELYPNFHHMTLHFGFAEKPDVPLALNSQLERLGFDPAKATYFMGREVPVPSLQPHLPRWQERIYAFMTLNAVRAPDYFLIPPQQVVELGTKVEL
jgi:KUP system potassium uptake protein